MAFDVVEYRQVGDQGPAIWHIDDRDLVSLQPALRLYAKRTGLVVDEYGRTPFPPGTLGPLVAAVEETLVGAAGTESCRPLGHLLGLLRSAARRGAGVLFVGD